MLRVGQGHAGDTEELAAGARTGSDAHIGAPHAEEPGHEADELVVGASFDGAGRQTQSQAAVRDADHLAVRRPRDDPDRQAQAVARLAQR